MDLYCRAAHQSPEYFQDGEGTNNCPWAQAALLVLPSCRRHVCCSPCMPGDAAGAPNTAPVPALLTHSPARGRGRAGPELLLQEPWDSASLARALCPHTTSVQGQAGDRLSPL